jgi:hypothetical protein
MPSVVEAITKLGVEVQHIPGGCTGMCQPVDVGVGKPLKARVRHLWEEWIMKQSDPSAIFKPPPRETLSRWIVNSLLGLEAEMIRNSWKHHEFSYFED